MKDLLKEIDLTKYSKSRASRIYIDVDNETLVMINLYYSSIKYNFNCNTAIKYLICTSHELNKFKYLIKLYPNMLGTEPIIDDCNKFINKYEKLTNKELVIDSSKLVNKMVEKENFKNKTKIGIVIPRLLKEYITKEYGNANMFFRRIILNNIHFQKFVKLSTHLAERRMIDTAIINGYDNYMYNKLLDIIYSLKHCDYVNNRIVYKKSELLKNVI